MRRYLATARRYRWLLAAVLALVWGAGIVAAYAEYTTTFESTATVWVLRPPAELAQTSLDDPSATLLQTAASQQVDLLSQLLQTDSFLRDVVQLATPASLAAAHDEAAYLDDVRKRFHVKALGTNLLTISFAARDPATGPRMVKAALAARDQRTAVARVSATTALSTLYRKDYEVAQARALDAKQRLQDFNASHPVPLSDIDQHLQSQLLLSLDLAQTRLGDLQGRMDRAVLGPTLIEVSGLEFQVIDEPRETAAPKGGARPAMTVAAVALVAGIALAALLVLLGTHVVGPAAMQAEVRHPRRAALADAEALGSPSA
jgi:uncharacterized protein involved in exopolysaccharide biosynthesis